MAQRTLIFGLLSAAVLLLGAAGGAGSDIDHDLILWWRDWRAGAPRGTGALVLFTQLGGMSVLLAVALAAIVWLLTKAERGRALAFGLTVIGGRLVVELVKLAVARPRPNIDAWPVTVYSNSFPSAHAANSMITFVALALFVVPERRRLAALAVAVPLSLAVGATRPMLGVHWPSDVLAGWLFGLAWTIAGWQLSQRARTAA